jgi:hypothetical protein
VIISTPEPVPFPETGHPMPEDSTADLTARLNALRDVLENEIQSGQDAANARIDGVNAQRGILLDGLHADRSGLEKQVKSLRELQDAYHVALQQSAAQHEAAEAAQVANLAAAMQLQLDQRFTAMQDGTRLIQEEMDRRMQNLKDLLDERYQAQTRSFEEQRDSALGAVNAALFSAREAVAKAETATEKRFESVNEFRQTLTDQAAQFPTRQEVSAQMQTVSAATSRNSDAIKDIELRFTSRLDTMAGQAGGASEFRTEHRLDTGQIMQLVVLLLIAAGVVISVVVK